MPVVVGVTFRKIGKVYYFDPNGLELHEGDFVISETAHGLEFGEVVLEPRDVPEEEVVAPLKCVVRIAGSEDLDREAANRDREKQGLEVCEQKIAEHGLPMKLLDAECSFDGSVITFSFSAEGRIDFRELVKDVAGILKTRVQLHQIGVRDEAKIIGGYGACGRPLCCATFLTTFEPVSMKMAKDQSLFLNPAKFSGCCGKLLCCLRYEHEFYKEAQERLPSIGAILQVDQVKAKVIDVNVISNVLTLETEEGVQLHVPAQKIKLEGLCRKHGISCGMTDRSCHTLVQNEELAETAPEVVEELENEDYVDFIQEPFEETYKPPARPSQRSHGMSGIKFREVTEASNEVQEPVPLRPDIPKTPREKLPRRPNRPGQQQSQDNAKSENPENKPADRRKNRGKFKGRMRRPGPPRDHGRNTQEGDAED